MLVIEKFLLDLKWQGNIETMKIWRCIYRSKDITNKTDTKLPKNSYTIRNLPYVTPYVTRRKQSCMLS